MPRLKSHEAGVSHVVAVLFILAIGIIGAVAIRISSAQRYRYTLPTRPNFTSGSSAVCRSNGVTIVPPAGQSCSITQGASGLECKINGAPTTCPGGNSSPSGATQGTPGAATNYNNIRTSTGSTGSSGSSVCTANGATITAPAGSTCSISSNNGVAQCYINNQPAQCQ